MYINGNIKSIQAIYDFLDIDRKQWAVSGRYVARSLRYKFFKPPIRLNKKLISFDYDVFETILGIHKKRMESTFGKNFLILNIQSSSCRTEIISSEDSTVIIYDEYEQRLMITLISMFLNGNFFDAFLLAFSHLLPLMKEYSHDEIEKFFKHAPFLQESIPISINRTKFISALVSEITLQHEMGHQLILQKNSEFLETTLNVQRRIKISSNELKNKKSLPDWSMFRGLPKNIKINYKSFLTRFDPLKSASILEEASIWISEEIACDITAIKATMSRYPKNKKEIAVCSLALIGLRWMISSYSSSDPLPLSLYKYRFDLLAEELQDMVDIWQEVELLRTQLFGPLLLSKMLKDTSIKDLIKMVVYYMKTSLSSFPNSKAQLELEKSGMHILANFNTHEELLDILNSSGIHVDNIDMDSIKKFIR